AIRDNRRGLPIAVIETVLRGVLAGMIEAHAKGVLHRDLKPGNVLLHLDQKPLTELTVEEVKVVDFGLGAKNVDTLRSMVQSASIDRDNKLVGTLAYMAPELRDGHQQADARSDLFSIGVMLFEMLTGERPAGAELPSVIRRDTPPGLDAIFQRLYAHCDRRYESAGAVLDDLNQRMRPLRATPPLPRHAVAAPPRTSGACAGTSRGARCPKCNQAIEGDDQFCTQCGVQLVESIRRCRECGGFPGPQDQFCIFCGASLSTAVGA
ncbi:MAG: protein kinase, partial [Planctomycetes bacterium]|nr:protein kinase [Planctomycetota bacterium]